MENVVPLRIALVLLTPYGTIAACGQAPTTDTTAAFTLGSYFLAEHRHKRLAAQRPVPVTSLTKSGREAG